MLYVLMLLNQTTIGFQASRWAIKICWCVSSSGGSASQSRWRDICLDSHRAWSSPVRWFHTCDVGGWLWWHLEATAWCQFDDSFGSRWLRWLVKVSVESVSSINSPSNCTSWSITRVLVENRRLLAFVWLEAAWESWQNMTKHETENRKSAWLLQATDVVQVTGVQGLQQILQIRTILLADGSEWHLAAGHVQAPVFHTWASQSLWHLATIRLAQAGHEGEVGLASGGSLSIPGGTGLPFGTDWNHDTLW